MVQGTEMELIDFVAMRIFIPNMHTAQIHPLLVHGREKKNTEEKSTWKLNSQME